jgi:hypothetical protein
MLAAGVLSVSSETCHFLAYGGIVHAIYACIEGEDMRVFAAREVVG